MGGEKTTTQNSTTAYQTPEEIANQKLDLARKQANAPMQQQLDNNQYNLANLLLMGQNLPGNLQGAQGISENQTQSMVNQSLRDIGPGFQSAGILDSGLAAQIASQTSAGVRNQNAQFNVSAFQNLLNQALGGSSNLTGAYNTSNQIMNNQLAGLRTLKTSGSTIGMNPFLKSFQTEFGSGLAKTANSGISSGFGSMGNGGSFAQVGSAAMTGACWVAAELFDGWSDIRTIRARFFIMFHTPSWFRNAYIKYGKAIASFINNKPLIKKVIKPLFEYFSYKGKEKLNGCN